MSAVAVPASASAPASTPAPVVAGGPGLLAVGRVAFSYFQAVRLIRRQGLGQALRVRPSLSLAFPESDLERIEPWAVGGRQGYRITATFFGLYGVSSPLPTYYSEDLLDDEREGRRARREFLDIFHASLYPLLYDAWRKYRLQLRAVEEDDAQALDAVYSFMGLGTAAQRRAIPHSGALLRYLGLFAQHTRSALGLRTLLADAFAPAQVEIESCVLQWLPIPDAQRLRLGERAHVLGEDSYLGQQIEDSENLLRIALREVPEPLFLELLPGAAAHRRLQLLTRFYLTRPLQVAVDVTLAPGAGRDARFGAGAWSRLGLDTWLPAGEDAGDSRVSYRLAHSLTEENMEAADAAR